MPPGKPQRHLWLAGECGGEIARTRSQDLDVKTRSQYRLLGRRHHGVDDPKIVTGKPLYGIDVQLPGMVYASFTKCPAVGGKVKTANLDEIKTLPGVLDAFVVDGTGKPSEVMPGVAIIAKNTWAAFQAKAKLKWDWDESEASKDSTQQILGSVKEEIAFKIRPKTDAPMSAMSTNPSPMRPRSWKPIMIMNLLSHATLEPMNSTAPWLHDGVDGSLVADAATQPRPAAGLTLAYTKLPEEKALITRLCAGGGFGRRLMNELHGRGRRHRA